MKKIFTLTLLLACFLSANSQLLENTSWRFRPLIVSNLSSLNGVDYDSIVMKFNNPDIFEVIGYSQQEGAQMGMKGFWSEMGNTGFFVDTMQTNQLCVPTDTCFFSFNIVDTVLNLSNMQDQCGVRATIMMGDYYGDNSASTASIAESDINFFSVFPNPAKDFIQLNEEYEEIQIIAADGKLMGNFYKKHIIFITDFPKGMYWISVEKNGRRVYKKLIKQ